MQTYVTFIQYNTTHQFKVIADTHTLDGFPKYAEWEKLGTKDNTIWFNLCEIL